MEEYPEKYGFVNFKISIRDQHGPILKEAEDLWAPPDHEVFQLVPKDFAILVEHVNVWAVYIDLLEHLEQLPTLKDFQLDGYNQEEVDYLTNQNREMIACLGSELENLQLLLVDQDNCYMGECNGRLGAENDVMWDENMSNIYLKVDSAKQQHPKALLALKKLDFWLNNNSSYSFEYQLYTMTSGHPMELQAHKLSIILELTPFNFNELQNINLPEWYNSEGSATHAEQKLERSWTKEHLKTDETHFGTYRATASLQILPNLCTPELNFSNWNWDTPY
ncbi:hypothetical protein L218DRAFT_951323 [Marasmius fiardii PR-910]|nr:hypothetical protein L218DRAFT_951323 [Marasmius fiardii PR-910]